MELSDDEMNYTTSLANFLKGLLDYNSEVRDYNRKGLRIDDIVDDVIAFTEDDLEEVDIVDFVESIVFYLNYNDYTPFSNNPEGVATYTNMMIMIENTLLAEQFEIIKTDIYSNLLANNIMTFGSSSASKIEPYNYELMLNLFIQDIEHAEDPRREYRLLYDNINKVLPTRNAQRFIMDLQDFMDNSYNINEAEQLVLRHDNIYDAVSDIAVPGVDNIIYDYLGPKFFELEFE